MRELFAGCSAYHWHNQWQAIEARTSIAAAYNRLVDEALARRYGLEPCPAFEH